MRFGAGRTWAAGKTARQVGTMLQAAFIAVPLGGCWINGTPPEPCHIAILFQPDQAHFAPPAWVNMPCISMSAAVSTTISSDALGSHRP